jgi:hypothetical protein
MFFASVQVGKAYVSSHLMPLYMNPAPASTISPALKKRMHVKSCFNLTDAPDRETIAELKKLTAAALRQWASRNWL